MKSRIILFLTMAALGAGTLAITSCGKSSAEKMPQAAAGATQDAIVKVEALQPQDFSEVVLATGTIAAEEDVMVPAEEGGRLLKWLVPKGAHVKAGQPIAQLDDALLRAGFDAANATYKLAETNYEKQKKVFDEQALSELQLKTFEYQRDAAKAGADLAKARLDKMTIKSPVNGVLDNRLVDAGEMIGPGSPVAHVVNLGTLKVTIGVPERYSSRLSSGDNVALTVDALSGEKFNGKIRFIGSAVNRDSRAIPIEVGIASAGGRLKPDMIATASISLGVRKNSIVILQDYLQTVDKGRTVVYVDNNGVAEERVLTIGGTDGNRVLVTSGLNAGDRLITLGFQNVANGQKLIVHD